jgi:hypothetical protein
MQFVGTRSPVDKISWPFFGLGFEELEIPSELLLLLSPHETATLFDDYHFPTLRRTFACKPSIILLMKRVLSA